MKARGWFIQPQPGCTACRGPRTLTVQAVTWPLIEEFLTALRESAAEARGKPAASPDPELMQVAEAIDPDVLDLAAVQGCWGSPASTPRAGPPCRMRAPTSRRCWRRCRPGFGTLC